MSEAKQVYSDEMLHNIVKYFSESQIYHHRVKDDKNFHIGDAVFIRYTKEEQEYSRYVHRWEYVKKTYTKLALITDITQKESENSYQLRIYYEDSNSKGSVSDWELDCKVKMFKVSFTDMDMKKAEKKYLKKKEIEAEQKRIEEERRKKAAEEQRLKEIEEDKQERERERLAREEEERQQAEYEAWLDLPVTDITNRQWKSMENAIEELRNELEYLKENVEYRRRWEEE